MLETHAGLGFACGFGIMLKRLRSCAIGVLLLELALAASASAQILNSERIEQTFGSYGIDVLYSDEVLRLSNLYSELGDQLGEEEWVVLDFDTEIDSSTASSTLPVSRFSFGFTANRHLSFYVIRIFVPIFIIIMVSWITFFLRDYNKRVDVTAGNKGSTWASTLSSLSMKPEI